MSAEPDVKRETPIWEELAANEEAERQREQERLTAPAIAAELQPAASAEEGQALRPAATVAERPGAVRFASEVLPGTRPEDLTRGITGGGRRRGGGGSARGPQRETEEQARARRAAASRRGGSRRAMEAEIGDQLEAIMDDDDDFGFLSR